MRTSRKYALPVLSPVTKRWGMVGWYCTLVNSEVFCIVAWASVIPLPTRPSWRSTFPSSLEEVTIIYFVDERFAGADVPGTEEYIVQLGVT